MGRTSKGWPCIKCFADILHPPSVEKPIHKTSKCKVRHLRNYHLFNFHFLVMILCYRFRLVMVNTFVIDITILYYRLVSTVSLSESVESNMAEAVHWYTVNVIAMELMSRNDIVAVYRDLLGNRALFILLVRSYCESCVFLKKWLKNTTIHLFGSNLSTCQGGCTFKNITSPFLWMGAVFLFASFVFS